MIASNRGFRSRGGTNINARHLGTQHDDVGNRKGFDESRIPPDNIGNKVEQDLIADFVHDGMGNNVEDEPAHIKSGILAQLMGPHQRTVRKVQQQNRPLPKSGPAYLPKAKADQVGDEYVRKLNEEFTKLLSKKAGLAFSFSMKALGEADDTLSEDPEELPEIKNIISQILQSSDIKASVGLSHYRTSAHHFAVFFVGPEEDDPARSKELIAALRQVINDHTQRMIKSPVNIFLVLANAKTVIEEHLFKIGAKKTER